jgi:uncharacterized protein (TIGR00369 family)
MNSPDKAMPPFYHLLGLEAGQDADGNAIAKLGYDSENTNRKGDVHGGAIMSLADVAMGLAIRAGVKDISLLSTVSMTISFVKVGQGDLIGRGRLVRAGRSLAFATAEVLDAEQEVVATAQGTFRLIR